MAQKTKSILTSDQWRVLTAIAAEPYFTKRFYLAGGTALSEFYLHHRRSEDLDFFCESAEVDPRPILRFFQTNAKTLRIKKIETKNVLGLHTFFLHFSDRCVLKVDFNYYPFPLIEKGTMFNDLAVESIYDIAVDKVHTIVMKPRARDFIDIYFITQMKRYDFRDLIKQAKTKFDWHISAIELGSRFFAARQASDYPRMLKKIDHRAWKDFFAAEAKKLKKDIFI